MLTRYFPRTADICDGWLVFYDTDYALARCEMHADQDYNNKVLGSVEIWPDDFEGDYAFVRLKPETLRVFERGVFTDRGAEQIYFDRDDTREILLEDLPALKGEAEKRAYLDAYDRWARDPVHDDENAETPPAPVFEPARAEWETWQALLAEWEALGDSLPPGGRPAMTAEQRAADDALWSKIKTAYDRYRSKVPMTANEPKAADEVQRQKLFGAPANAIVGQAALVIAGQAALVIDDFNEGWPIEKWPDAPQLPVAVEQAYPAIYRQLNSAIRRITTMAQKPRTFRVDRVAHILGILACVHEDTYKALCDLNRTKLCALPEEVLTRARKAFEERVLWEIQGKNRESYIVTNAGKPDPASFDNVRIFLNLRGVDLRFDEFTNSIEGREGRYADWQRLREPQRKALWLDTHTSGHNFNCSYDFFRAAIERIAREYTYDALRDAVDTLEWDGVKRLGNWLSIAVGCPDDSYHRAVGANLIGGLVKRAREPGAKHDETVIFISEEGKAKSTLCKSLALRPDWFIDSVELGGRPQDIVPQLWGKQVIELAELAGMSKTETTKLKAFMSRENDNATLKYKEEASDHFRRHLFVATTNDDAPLLSQTGNRRWLPVYVVGTIDIDWIRENVEQLYAEAAEWHAAGEDFRIPKELWSVAGQHQEAARERTGAEDVLSFAFGNVTDCYVTAADVQLFASERRLPLKDVRAALKGLGFASVAHREGKHVGKVWRRGTPDAAVRFKAETYVNRPCELRVDNVTVTPLLPCPVTLPPFPTART